MRNMPSEFFLQASLGFLREFYGKIEEAVNRLDDQQVWWRPNPASTSIGNLLWHLAGNVVSAAGSGAIAAADQDWKTILMG